MIWLAIIRAVGRVISSLTGCKRGRFGQSHPKRSSGKGFAVVGCPSTKCLPQTFVNRVGINFGPKLTFFTQILLAGSGLGNGKSWNFGASSSFNRSSQPFTMHFPSYFRLLDFVDCIFGTKFRNKRVYCLKTTKMWIFWRGILVFLALFFFCEVCLSMRPTKTFIEPEDQLEICTLLMLRHDLLFASRPLRIWVTALDLTT